MYFISQVVSNSRHSTVYKYFFVTLAASALGLVGQHAFAASPGNIPAPFDEGTSWNVCQGYDNTRGTHNGTSHLSFDLTDAGCNSVAAGRNVRAPLTGSIAWYSAGSGSLCVSEPVGRSVMLTHIDSSLSPGSLVTAGQIVGTIAQPGQRQNNGVAHLHFQAWSTPRCNGDSNAVPFDSAHNMRICGAPDLSDNGPNTFNNGTWGSTQFIADACNTSIPANSPAVYRFYSTVTKHHLFTIDVNEANVLRSSGAWNDEGTAYWIKAANNCAASESVYRLYSEKLKVHMYTMDENERTVLSQYPPEIWRYEGVAFCASRTSTPTTTPVYRFYSDGLSSPHYTTDENEKTELSKHPEVWRYEGIAYYAYSE